MAMPQRDETIEEIKRLDALLGSAVMYDEKLDITHCSAASFSICRQSDVVTLSESIDDEMHE